MSSALKPKSDFGPGYNYYYYVHIEAATLTHTRELTQEWAHASYHSDIYVKNTLIRLSVDNWHYYYRV